MLKVIEMKEGRKKSGYFVSLSPDKALELIKSLTENLIQGHGNANRAEFYDDKGMYFSIAVDFTQKHEEESGIKKTIEGLVALLIPKKTTPERFQEIWAVLINVPMKYRDTLAEHLWSKKSLGRWEVK